MKEKIKFLAIIFFLFSLCFGMSFGMSCLNDANDAFEDYYQLKTNQKNEQAVTKATEPIMASTTESHSANVELEINDEYLTNIGYSTVVSIPQFDNKLSSDDGTDAVNIDIPILADQNINNESPNLNLYNPADNSSNLVFTFFKDDKLIYQSREILPGEIVRVDFTTILDKGSFEIKAVVAPSGGDGVNNTFTINHI